jgi:hypothetical protein
MVVALNTCANAASQRDAGAGQLWVNPDLVHAQVSSFHPLTTDLQVRRLLVCFFVEARDNFYSITSSARVSSVGGNTIPSDFAVLRLTKSSNLVGNSTGKSAGFSPLKILSIYIAARRKMFA